MIHDEWMILPATHGHLRLPAERVSAGSPTELTLARRRCSKELSASIRTPATPIGGRPAGSARYEGGGLHGCSDVAGEWFLPLAERPADVGFGGGGQQPVLVCPCRCRKTSLIIARRAWQPQLFGETAVSTGGKPT